LKVEGKIFKTDFRRIAFSFFFRLKVEG